MTIESKPTGIDGVAAMRDDVRNLARGIRDEAAKAADRFDAIVDKAPDHEVAGDLLATLGDTFQVVDAFREQLTRVRTAIQLVEAERERRERYNERWLAQARSSLAELLVKDPVAGARRWTATCAELLGAWEIDSAVALASAELPFPPDFAHRALIADGLRAIREGNHAGSIATLEHFLGDKDRRSDLSADTRVALQVLLARIRVTKLDPADFKQAQRLLSSAGAQSPRDGRVDAAWSDWYQAKNDESQALAYAQQAIDDAPAAADSYIVMGARLEAEKAWDRADEMFRHATALALRERDPLKAFGRLLVAVPGAAWLALAETLRERAPESALAALDRAVDAGVLGASEAAAHRAYLMKGELLVAAGRDKDAAEAYFHAGETLYRLSDFRSARPYLERAIELAPDSIDAYWVLADALSLLSYDGPEPSYFDGDALAAALQIWERARAIRPPNRDDAWAYVTRAMISSQHANVPGADAWTDWWNAVAWIEQAFLLQAPNARWWAGLAQFYRSNNAESNALAATGHALDLDASDNAVTEERAAILANRGEWDEALALIEPHLEGTKDQQQRETTWLMAVKTYVLRGMRRASDAIGPVLEVCSREPRNIWYRSMHAATLEDLNRVDEAIDVWRGMWADRGDPAFASELHRIACAGVDLARTGDPSPLDEAIALLRNAARQPQDEGNALRDLGLALMLAGKADEGRRALVDGIRKCANKREIAELLRQIDSFAATIAAKEAATFRAEAERRLAEVMVARTAEEELTQMLRNEGQNSLARVGMLASLARLHNAAVRPLDAARIYNELLGDPANFPAARDGLRAALSRFAQAADQLLLGQEPQAALDLLVSARDFASTVGDPGLQAELAARASFALVALDRDGEQEAARSIEVFANGQRSRDATATEEAVLANAGESFAQVALASVGDVKQYWALDARWAEWEKTASARMSEALGGARRRLAGYMEVRYGLVQPPASVPSVSLIKLEIGTALVPEDADTKRWPLFSRHLPAMRERFRAQFGIELPGIDVRSPPDWTGDYGTLGVISIQGAWVDYGWLHPESLAVGETADDVIAGKLETTIRRELPSIFGVQETEEWLDARAASDGALAKRIDEVLPTVSRRFAFGRMLRALLRDQVPLTRPQDLLTAAESTSLDEAGGILRAAARARLLMRDLLPGNAADVRRITLSPELEQGLVRLAVPIDGEMAILAPPQDLQAWLVELRQFIPQDTQRLALVVDEEGLRSTLARLIELEYPSMQVLTRGEADAAAAQPTAVHDEPAAAAG